MLSFYLRSAIRSISRKKVFSVLNISGLALGICVFLLTLEYYSYETGFNTFHKNLSGLYRVNVASAGIKSPSTVPTLAPLMQENIPGVKAAIRFADNFNSGAIVSYQSGNNAGSIKSFREEGCVFVDRSFLDAFSFPMLAGSNRLDDPHTVVITATIAKKIFGDDNAVGKIIQLHNQFGVLPCEVTGVIKDIPQQSDIRFDYLFSSEVLNDKAYTTGSDWAKLDSWGNNSYTTYVWLNQNANPETVAATSSGLWAKKSPDYKREDGTIRLQPVAELHLGNALKDDNPTYGSRPMVYFILALGILVLCIAWINYINFSTAFALSQAKDIGIHKIIGSDKKQIVLRYLTESLLLNLAGLLFAFLLATSIQGLFNYITAKPLSFNYINNINTWLTGAGILLGGIVLCGGYVGIILSRFKPISAIRFNDTGKTGNMLLRKGLVVFQFVVSILFIAATIIAYQQVQFMKNHDLGMSINNLTVIDGPRIKGNDTAFKINANAFRNELVKLPFVEKMSITGSIPGGNFSHNFGADGITKQNPEKGDEKKSYKISIIDENYFDTYGIAFLNGINFTSANADIGFHADRVILNETAARELGFAPAEAVNQFISWGRKFQVIGVIKDYHHLSLKEKIEPIIYVPQHNPGFYTVKMSAAGFPQKMATIKALYEKIFPGNPFGYQVLKDTYDAQYADEQRAGVVALSISVMVILIACLGLIGLSVFTAKRRNKEIGIRKILGASVSSLFTLLSKDFLLLVLVAFFIATPIAWVMMDKWLQDFAYRIKIGVTVFLLSGIAAMLIALLTISFQAIKAAVANPVKSLRTE